MKPILLAASFMAITLITTSCSTTTSEDLPSTNETTTTTQDNLPKTRTWVNGHYEGSTWVRGQFKEA